MDKQDRHPGAGTRADVPIGYANSISEMLAASGKFDEAEKVCRETLRMLADHCGLTKKHGYAAGIAHGTLGNLLLRRGGYDEAEREYKRALEIYSDATNGREGVAITYANLGALCEVRGDLRKAAEYWSLSDDLFSTIGDQSRQRLVGAWLEGVANDAHSEKPLKARQVFISVKYEHDQVVERSLAAYLRGAGYEPFRHTGTADFLDRATLPPLIADGPLRVAAPSLLPAGRQMDSPDVSPSLVRYLVQQVCSCSLVVVVWSAYHSSSFWCTLELEAALLARKPIVAIRSDYHPFPLGFKERIRHVPAEIVEITCDYRTSAVLAVINRLCPEAGVSVDADAVLRELEEFIAKQGRRAVDIPVVEPNQYARYEDVVRILRDADDRGDLYPAIGHLVGSRAREYPELQGDTRTAIEGLVKSGLGDIDAGFRRYLERVASGIIEARLERWYYTYLLGEILDHVFLPPELPVRLEEHYVRRINEAFAPPVQAKVKSLIEDMVHECLFTREFVEHFGYLLADVRTSRGPLAASRYWDLCVQHMSEAT